MVHSKQLTNKSNSTRKMSLRSRSAMQNTPTTSVQSDDNNGSQRIPTGEFPQPSPRSNSLLVSSPGQFPPVNSPW